ncbi:RnfH family protein [Aquincola tertiaricarbonis]|uniref:UPF0125 protein MW290_23650 n=1 Tax=Aquincola tertiaricarbonis TaxID=391953 RepID=A0ABY4S6F3_AQUTE|nr:RnfH family protein [Aquincola tertiaricarbonis]URI08578.1 RnfH family protein [Aquincola tertiaricarbonis]
MATAEGSAGLLRIEVVCSPAAEHTERVALQLPPGSTVGDALARSGLAERHGLAADAWKVGVWGRLAPPAQPLRDLDRVELYRPLQVDPKEARRLRYKGQRQGRKTPPAARG